MYPAEGADAVEGVGTRVKDCGAVAYIGFTVGAQHASLVHAKEELR